MDPHDSDHCISYTRSNRRIDAENDGLGDTSAFVRAARPSSLAMGRWSPLFEGVRFHGY